MYSVVSSKDDCDLRNTNSRSVTACSAATATSDVGAGVVDTAPSAATAVSQNTRPTTDASCSVRSSDRASRSRRACSTAVSVGGTRAGSKLERSTCHAPSSAVGLDHTLVDEHRDELLDVERVAVGPLRRQAATAARGCPDLLQYLTHQRAGRYLREGIENDPSRICCRQPGRRSSRAGRRGADDEHRNMHKGRSEIRDEIERLVVGPVQILEQESPPASAARQRADVLDEVGTSDGCELAEPRQAPYCGCRAQVEAEPVADEVGLVRRQAQLRACAQLVGDELPEYRCRECRIGRRRGREGARTATCSRFATRDP